MVLTSARVEVKMFKEAHERGEKLVIGLIHLKPMPGTAYYQDGDYEESIKKAVADAKALENGGASGCLIQTVDFVYPKGDDTDYVRVSCLSVIANEVKKVVSSDFKVGVQIMWNCITPSLAVAKSIKADFTRCTALVGETESPFGRIEADPIKVLEYRNKIQAQGVDLLAEVAGYHFKAEYNKENFISTVAGSLMVKANAVEVYNKDETMNNRLVDDIRSVYPHVPIILGGGTNVENVSRRMINADGALVGSCFENAKWGSRIDESIVAEYMKEVRKITNK